MPKYCLDPKKPKQRVTDDLDNFELAGRPDRIEEPMHPGKFIEMTNDKLVYDFQLTEKVDCYL